jgi:hypothetical protein
LVPQRVEVPALFAEQVPWEIPGLQALQYLKQYPAHCKRREKSWQRVVTS